MKRKKDYDDSELRRTFSALPRLKAPEKTVRELYVQIENVRKAPEGRMHAFLSRCRVRREVIIAVFATLLFAVPLTYWVTQRFAEEQAPTRAYVVRFVYEDENARSVHLIGDFNNWGSNRIVLERVGESKLWSAEITLEEGLYKYGFLVNEKYIVSDPLSGFTVKDSFGNESSLIVLADGKEGGESL